MENKKSQNTPANVPQKQSPQKAPAPKKKPASDASAKLQAPINQNKPVPPQSTAPKHPQCAPAAAPAKEKKEKASKGISFKLWCLIIAAVVVVALVAGGVYLGGLLGADSGQEHEEVKNTEQEKIPTEDYTTPITDNTPADPPKIILPGYPQFDIDANSREIAMVLQNPDGNPCYFQYTLTIVELGEEIYRSALIAPGESPTQQIPLDQPLAKGIYTLRIAINTFSLIDGTTPMNGGVQEVQLTVK